METGLSQAGARRRRRRRMMAEMNVVPYIDVMLVLLIIFMVGAPLVTQGVKVDLPQTRSEPMPPSERPPIVVSVDADGRYYIDFGDQADAPVDAGTLVNRVAAIRSYQPGARFLVNGDARVPYQRVVELMALLQSAGVEGVGLMTRPPATGEG